MELAPGKKVYFLSDFHLGAPDFSSSLIREKKIVAFLENARRDAQQIIIAGDVFDFWYEYKTAVPKHFVRLLGKLAEITDSGIPVILFAGNHDMWMRGYFQTELNVPVYFEPRTFTWNNKKFYVGHGDGLGPGDHGYKFIKKIFRNRFCQWLFGQMHPTLGMGIANYFSRKSRQKTGSSDAVFLGEENEWLVIHSREMLSKEHYDYFIFGHRHLPLTIKLNDNAEYINLGDWITHFTYAVFDGNSVQLKKWQD
jgi:UDP-2,3-diacylglucosamine hydrolase